MFTQIKQTLQSRLTEALQTSFPDVDNLPELELEIPADKTHGDYSTNIALKSAKILKKTPLAIAEDFIQSFEEHTKDSELAGIVARMEVKQPGFINFYLNSAAYLDLVGQILKEKDSYGKNDLGKSEKVQLEFVSANPTGPLSIAHARQAAVGDALANILNACGFKATKEYYINDGGNQINMLGESLKVRAIEHLGGKAELPEGGYEGDYVKDMAQLFMEQEKLTSLEDVEASDTAKWSQFGVDYLLDVIKKDLDDFRVAFDVWSYESKIAPQDKIAPVLDELKKKGYVYEKDGAEWFKTTDFGDDKDRVVKKSDGSFTYLSPDIVYHKNKFERGFDRVLNIWGPDHHGYIPRIKAAAQALGKDADALEVLIVQLASVFRDGEAISMSTRKGQFISLREVIDEVGTDAARYFFLMRQIKQHLDFDLEVAKKETPENPVYYVQYAHARVNSLNRKAKEEGVTLKETNFSLLKEAEELELIKMLGGFEDRLKLCCNQLDPASLVTYLHELTMTFTRFYERHSIVTAEGELASERLALANATRIVIANGLKLLGISTPEKM